ncbi:hypothetical protein [Streptacidiphilus pinicola]|uniref:hypothetical protein n=1 Tax=Streptacidiphilus pinicola TaxID=2219663 RepID=UPI001402B7D1|nr:hypothetical protein [Streptacidiphilus pinicola]
MPQNGTTPQSPDADDELDLFDEAPDDPQGTRPPADDEFDDLVESLRDEWP